jgi:hypothetical protein
MKKLELPDPSLAEVQISMFQAPQASNSVFTFRSRTIDANQTISADPAIMKRGPVNRIIMILSLMTLIEAKNILYLLIHRTNLINRQNKHTT